jgi:hypothetical protein
MKGKIRYGEVRRWGEKGVEMKGGCELKGCHGTSFVR